MKKKILLLGIIVLVIGLASFVIINKVKSNHSVIPDDYIAVFHGGVGEKTYATYIYKIDNGHANYGFKYINTMNTTASYGNPKWTIKIKNTGKVAWTDDVFAVAKENGAFSYVMLPNDNKTYTIEEFKQMFLMN